MIELNYVSVHNANNNTFTILEQLYAKLYNRSRSNGTPNHGIIQENSNIIIYVYAMRVELS